LLANDDLVITDLANADPDMPASPPRIRVFHLEPIGRAGRLEIASALPSRASSHA
jgi:hypothetical protein